MVLRLALKLAMSLTHRFCLMYVWMHKQGGYDTTYFCGCDSIELSTFFSRRLLQPTDEQ